MKQLGIIIFFILQLTLYGCGSGGGSTDPEANTNNSTGNTGTGNGPTDPGTPPLIKNLHISVADYNPSTGMAGDVEFSNYYWFSNDTRKVFMEFNGLLIDDGTGPAGGRLPHFTFVVPPATNVYAMADGIVTAVELNPGVSDYEIRIAPDSTSNYLIVYDHVVATTVLVGQTVSAGEKIAETTLMKVEADVTLNHSTGLCPVDFFDPAGAVALEAKISKLMSDWEAYMGDTTLYDEAAMYKVGCVTQTDSI